MHVRVWILLTSVLAMLSVAAATPSSATDFAFVTTTDFTTGSSSVVWLDGFHTTTTNVASLHSDAVSRYHNGLIYVVNRAGGDNIQVLDPQNGFATVRQFSVGNGADPHDIVLVSDTKAYVTRYNETGLWIVDPSSGAHTGTIDLSSLADADGIPEMDQMALAGGWLFVTIQRLDRDYYWLPEGTSYVAVIDVAADALVDTDPVTPGTQPITLLGADPFSDIQLDPYGGRLYVSCVGTFAVADDGVEAIDPVTLQATGVILSEANAGGDVSDVEIVAPDKGYAIISNASFHNELVCFNPQTGLTCGTLYAPGDFVLNDIEPSPDGELFLADRTATLPGIRIYDIATDTEITSGPINVGLPPFDIAFSVPTPTGTNDDSPSLIDLGESYPNPFNPVTTIPFSLARPGEVRLTVHDARGRRVRTLVTGARPSGPQEATWDGRDGAGRPVASGVYFVRLAAGGQVLTTKAVLLK